MPGRTDSRGRLLLLLALVTVISGGLMLRLAYWQVTQHQSLVAISGQETLQRETRPALRGTIYDRTGKVVLAQTIYRDRLVAAPHDLTDDQKARVGDALVDYLGLDADGAAQLRHLLAGQSYYVVLATDLDPDVSKEIRSAIESGGLPGIALEPQAIRVYPQAGGAPGTSLAAQLIGFVNGDGKGQYGVEQAYDSQLAGRPQLVLVDRSILGPAGETIEDRGSPGADIRLTIDAGLQLALEQEVFAAWVADRAKTVSAVVMDPKTGEILAEASYPTYDANQYGQTASRDPSLFVDPVISRVYEPGSVFKMLLASAALQNGTVTLDSKVNDSGVMRLSDGTEVADANRRAMGTIPFSDIVAWSRNVGVTKVALKLGKDVATSSKTLYSTWLKYGIGARTGIDLAGEVPGLVNDPSRVAWRPIDLANGSFGQGVAATQLQVLRAYTAMANGGTLVQPHVALPSSGAAAPAASRTVIDPILSDKLTWLMGHVVSTVPSYSSRTLIRGYSVGGKTGTAQIWDPTLNDGKGDWKTNVFNYSFYGYVGQTGPQVMIGVVINEGTPTRIGQGILDMPVQSYELFRRIATDAVTSLDIPPQAGAPALPKGQKGAPVG